MIIHRVIQGTPEWIRLRLGEPTASRFSRILTPKKGELSASATGEIAACVAERFLGKQLEDAERTTAFMERGHVLEDYAVNEYELDHSCDVERVGFITDDANELGCSPDGLVGDDGIIEIKCPNARNHVLAMMQGISSKYNCQIQGNLWITQRKWCDTISYNPAMPMAVFRVERDDAFIAKMVAALSAFIENLETACERFGVPSDWREQIANRVAEQQKVDDEDARYFPQPEQTERADAEIQRAFLAGGRVR